MPVGPPPDSVSHRFVGVYAQAETDLLGQLARAVDRGVDTTDLRAEAAEATRLRREAERVAARLDLEAPPVIEEMHDRAARHGDRQAQRELRRSLGAQGIALPSDVPADLYEAGMNRGPVDQLARALTDRMTPVHRAVTRTVDDAYKHVMTQATVGSAQGTITRREAAQRALDQFARRGISGFTDRVGRRWDLTTYAEMASRASTARASVFAGLERMQSSGVDLVFTSTHVGACDLCGPWSGKVLRLTGSSGAATEQHLSMLADEPVSVQVAGSLDEAMQNGFLHPNCRHSVSAYLPGATRVPSVPPGNRAEQYADTQRQRYLERQVRAAKRAEAAAMDAAAKKDARRRVRAAQASAREHANTAGVPRRTDREQIHRAR